MIHRLGWACRAAPGHQGQGRRSATPGHRQAEKEVRTMLGGAPPDPPLFVKAWILTDLPGRCVFESVLEKSSH